MTRKEFQARLRERIGLFHLNYTAFLDADLVTLRYDMEEPMEVSPTVQVAEVDQVLDWVEAHARTTYRAQVAALPQIKLEGYVGRDPKREIPIGYEVFASRGGPFLVRYPDGSQGPKAYTDIADAIADAQFHAMAWPQPTSEDTAMTPEELRQQLPADYKAYFSVNNHGVKCVQVHHEFLDARSQTYPLVQTDLALAWALDHAKPTKLSIPEWAAQGGLLEKCQAQAPFGFTLERQGDFHFRVLGPDGVYVGNNLSNPEVALVRAKHVDARRVEHAIYCPPGYMVRNLSDDPSDPIGAWAAFREGSLSPVDKATYTQRDWAMTAAREAARRQEKDRRHHEQNGAVIVSKPEVGHIMLTREDIAERRSRIIAPAKVTQTEINQIVMVLPDGVTATGQLQWGPSANDPTTLWRLQRQSDGALTPWHNTETLTQISDVSLLFVMDQDEVQPDVAFPAIVQDIPESAHKAVADQVLPEGYSIRIRPAIGQEPVQFRTIYPEGGRSQLFKHATAAARHARDHWAELTVRDESRMPPGYGWTYDDLDGMPSMCKVVTYPDGENSEAFDEGTAQVELNRHAWDHFENKPQPTPEDTAMTHPAHEGPALREIEKMISLLEHGEWADTFPTHAQGQRLERVINDLVGKLRKADTHAHTLAEQLEQERSRQETNPGFIKQMTQLTVLLEARDFDGVAAMETTFSGSQALQAATLAVLQERDDANETLTRMSAEEPHNWAKATYELDALRDCANDPEKLAECDVTTPVAAPWKALLIGMQSFADRSADAAVNSRDSSQAAFDELIELRDLFAEGDLAGLEAYDSKFAIGAVWRSAAIEHLQGRQPEPAARDVYTLEDKIIDLALDVVAGKGNPTRAAVVLRDLIKESRA